MSIGDKRIQPVPPVYAVRLIELVPEQLAAYAHKAFLLGYLDGLQRASPHNADWVLGELFPDGVTYRRFHRTKFRQIYGAGFDMSRAFLYVQEREPSELLEPALTDGQP